MKTLTLAAAALALGAMALSANAQQLGAGHAQLQKATPIVKQAACRGFGPRCGPDSPGLAAPTAGAGAAPASKRPSVRIPIGCEAAFPRPRCLWSTAGAGFSGWPVNNRGLAALVA